MYLLSNCIHCWTVNFVSAHVHWWWWGGVGGQKLLHPCSLLSQSHVWTGSYNQNGSLGMDHFIFEGRVGQFFWAIIFFICPIFFLLIVHGFYPPYFCCAGIFWLITSHQKINKIKWYITYVKKIMTSTTAGQNVKCLFYGKRELAAPLSASPPVRPLYQPPPCEAPLSANPPYEAPLSASPMRPLYQPSPLWGLWYDMIQSGDRVTFLANLRWSWRVSACYYPIPWRLTSTLKTRMPACHVAQQLRDENCVAGNSPVSEMGFRPQLVLYWGLFFWHKQHCTVFIAFITKKCLSDSVILFSFQNRTEM